MLINIESIDMVSLLTGSWFAEISEYEKSKIISIIVMLCVRLDSLNGAFLKRFP